MIPTSTEPNYGRYIRTCLFLYVVSPTWLKGGSTFDVYVHLYCDVYVHFFCEHRCCRLWKIIPKGCVAEKHVCAGCADRLTPWALSGGRGRGGCRGRGRGRGGGRGLGRSRGRRGR